MTNEKAGLIGVITRDDAIRTALGQALAAEGYRAASEGRSRRARTMASLSRYPSTSIRSSRPYAGHSPADATSSTRETLRVPCSLFEPSGALLTLGNCAVPTGTDGQVVQVVALDRPGRVVQRCLLGAVQRVWLQLADGRLLPGRIERVGFDPAHGRTCLVRLDVTGMDHRAPNGG